MKKLLILLLLSYALFAQNIAQTIPPALKQKLCDQLANNANRCDNGSTLNYFTHKNLKNGNLLLFLYLNEHMPKMYNRPDAVTPVLVNKQGLWLSTVGENIINEDILSIHQDPHENIWVRAQWHIEGVYPSYFHSKNGINWKQTVLPKNRDVDCCFEFVDKPIFLYDSITLTFQSDTVKKSWTANYNSAMSSTPLWQAVAKAPSSSIETIGNESWKMTKTNSNVSFLNIHSNKKIFLSLKNKTNTKIYKIQVGAYLKKSSALKVQKSLQNIPYYKNIVKGKKYTRLFIGEFYTAQKAKAVLKNLQKTYPYNNEIQNAFVLKSKSD